MKKLITAFLFLTLLMSQTCFAMEKAFYVLRGNEANDAAPELHWINTLKQNIKSVDLIISQAYQVDSHGTVWDAVNQPVYNFAKENDIRFMALVTNQNYDVKEVDAFLNNKAAVEKAINSLSAACEKQKLYGIQIDFEQVPIQDRKQFTEFYTQLSQVLHQQGFKISAALFPMTSNPDHNPILNRLYKNWADALDFKAIGEASDFVSVMAYDQSTDGTTPGPTAGIPWVTQVIEQTLKFIPANKISLGIPVYSGYWRMAMLDGHSRAFETGISYAEVQTLLAENHQTLQWDSNQKVPYAFYVKDQFGEYIFAENAQSFQEKLKLIKQYQLRGFSVWRVGFEDPAIWKVLN